MQKAGLKKVYLFFSSAVIFLLHLPFVFAKSRPMAEMPAAAKLAHIAAAPPAIDPSPAIGTRPSLYDSLRLGSLGLARQACDMALRGWQYLASTGKLANQHIISIVDFSKPSSQKRLFVIDVTHYKLLFHTYVAHGMNSGLEYANQFSNTPESNKSSLGFYVTGSTYMGGNGYSLRLNGLEPGFNDKANSRDIVMHGADYVNESYIHSQGYIGRSWGCPAVAPKVSKPLINRIKNGSCLFVYAHNSQYLSRSPILRRCA
jgi:L,D-transpeptidase catalytic domain